MPEFDIESFRREPATHIVSLGAMCSNALNLRRHFNFQSGFPFDWWICSNKGVATVLQTPDVEVIYEETALHMTDDRRSIRNHKLGLVFHHEFPRENGSRGGDVVPEWREYLEEPKRRSTYLLNKLLDLNVEEARILFVRQTAAPEDTDYIAPVLTDVFSKSSWCYKRIVIPNNPNMSGWGGDQQAFESMLASFHVELDRSAHVPFDPARLDLDMPY